MFTRVQTNELCVNIWLIVTGHDAAEYCIRGAVWTLGTEARNAYPLLSLRECAAWLSSRSQILWFIPPEDLAHVEPHNLCYGTVVLCVPGSQTSDLLSKVALVHHLLCSGILPILYNSRIKPFLSWFSAWVQCNKVWVKNTNPRKSAVAAWNKNCGNVQNGYRSDNSLVFYRK